MAVKENERISFRKIENGFIVSHSYEEKTTKKGNDFGGRDYINKDYYAKTAKDTKQKMIDLQSAITIK